MIFNLSAKEVQYMYEITRYTLDNKKHLLTLYFDREDNYKEIMRRLFNVVEYLGYGDSTQPPIFDFVINDGQKRIKVTDSDRARFPGEGVQYCLNYLTQQQCFRDQNPTPRPKDSGPCNIM